MKLEEIIKEFRENLLLKSAEEIVEERILTKDAKHLSTEQITFIKNKIANWYNINQEEIQIYIVGSAKLGFSISEKNSNGNKKPRFRKFDIDSDIDVAIVSEKIFSEIWSSFSSFSFSKSYYPWDSNKLGDYLVSGSLRPDKFPSIFQSKRWWDCIRLLSNNRKLKRRKVRACLYYSTEMLKNYQIRSVFDCQKSEELNK